MLSVARGKRAVHAWLLRDLLLLISFLYIVIDKALSLHYWLYGAPSRDVIISSHDFLPVRILNSFLVFVLKRKGREGAIFTSLVLMPIDSLRRL